ncbi:myb-like protein V, partial [Temnothorax curvispinosus]|uniref:Myb-like protein V n=1 Tax=Temnothorax curvispinosus TaxID=300111 RepID=A0A6J1QY84_9HYME
MKFGINVDAARSGLGARLYQYREGEEAKYTIAYLSRSLKGAEMRYTITELECLALVFALRKWHTLLMGRHVRVHTDHKALQFLSTCVQNNHRIARWFEFMQEFDLEIIHIPGKENEIADTLSRSNEDEDPDEDDVKRIALIRDHYDGANTEEWIPWLQRIQAQDEELQIAVQEQPEEVYRRDGLIRIHLVYDGPYRVAREVRENAYLIESLDGQPKGVYNSRQLRPYRRPILREDQDNSDGESNNSHSENENSHQEDDDSTNEDINSQREDSEDFDSQEDELEIYVITMHEFTSSEEDDTDSDCDWTLLTQTAEEYDERSNIINININEDLNKEQHNSAEKQSKTNQLTGTSTMKTAEEIKSEQLIKTDIKIENAEEQLEDAEEHNYQPITSQEDIKKEIKIEITEENTSRQINTARNAEEQLEPIKEEIGENAEENAEKRDKLLKEEKFSQSEKDNIEERITEREKEISEKLSDIKREE